MTACVILIAVLYIGRYIFISEDGLYYRKDKGEKIWLTGKNRKKGKRK